jgi:hypothetical protein
MNKRIEGNTSTREFLETPLHNFSMLESTIESNLKSTQKIKSPIKGSANPAETRSKKMI